MRVLVVGATGRTGREVVSQALAEGMAVTAYARDPAALPPREGLEVLGGELGDVEALPGAVAGQDAVVSALGVGRPLRRDPAVVDGVGRVVAAMEAAGVRRLVYLSFIGVSASRPTAGPLIRNVVSRIVRNEVADHELKEEIVAGSSLDWTIVRPPLLTGGPPTGGYRCGEGISPSGAVPRLSRADVAGFMVRQLTDTAFVRRAPSLVP